MTFIVRGRLLQLRVGRLCQRKHHPTDRISLAPLRGCHFAQYFTPDSGSHSFQFAHSPNNHLLTLCLSPQLPLPEPLPLPEFESINESHMMKSLTDMQTRPHQSIGLMIPKIVLIEFDFSFRKFPRICELQMK
jgi:hypothetical protein